MELKDMNATEKRKAVATFFKWIFMCGLLCVAVVICCLIFWPSYNVYRQKKEGEAILAHAQYSREVAVAEAKAKMESSSLLAQADTIRAHGIARSNQIIGQSLTDAYLHWFWIDNIDKSNNVIYVPTEANLPILEAGRMSTSDGHK